MLALSELFFVFGVALLTAVAALGFLSLKDTHSFQRNESEQEPLSFLFDDGVLQHGSTAALRQFSLLPGAHVWDDLREALVPRFADFPDHAGNGASGKITLAAEDPNDLSVIDIRWRGSLCWLDITENDNTNGAEISRATEDLLKDALPYKMCCDTMPDPSWVLDRHGNLAWCNEAYISLRTKIGGDEDAPIFALPEGDSPKRDNVKTQDGKKLWYHIVAKQAGSRKFYHAKHIDDLVQSEKAQHTFIQTLAKTFAHLSIGLAVFDRRGQLGIFNPALIDLTGLQAGFLATQPTMQTFFDQLRENRRMPEPKNYSSWRQEITKVIAAASGDLYHETWTLEDGRTFSVQGRPHPEGATAFLIEDITPQVTQSRNFRIEVDQYEAVMDSLDDAVVVFSSTGILTFCNAVYRRMWDHDPEGAFADVTIYDAIKHWHLASGIHQSWGEVSKFVSAVGVQPAKEISIHLNADTVLGCRLQSISPDATLIRFRPAARSPKAQEVEMIETVS